MELEELKVYNLAMEMGEDVWLQKAFNRKLISEEQYNGFMENIEYTGKMLNNYIKSIKKSSTKF